MPSHPDATPRPGRTQYPDRDEPIPSFARERRRAERLTQRTLAELAGVSPRNYRLSPAYELVATRLLIPDDQLALPIGGTRKHVGWLELASRCRLPERAAQRVSSESMKQEYEALVRERARVLLDAAR